MLFPALFLSLPLSLAGIQIDHSIPFALARIGAFIKYPALDAGIAPASREVFLNQPGPGWLGNGEMTMAVFTAHQGDQRQIPGFLFHRRFDETARTGFRLAGEI